MSILQWFTRLPQLTRSRYFEAPRVESVVADTIEQGAIPSFRFYVLLGLSTVIATFGLIGNSSATIIGAMIIAPLMNPIVSIAFALVTFKAALLRKSAFTLVTGVILVILLSWLSTELIGSRISGAEILSRVDPNLLDLGVAMASGFAGAFAMSRKKVSDTLPGVAIAVALVPPLCVVGIGLAFGSEGFIDPEISRLSGTQGQKTIEGGAFLLFLTNLSAMIFCGSLVFLMQGYGQLKKALLGLCISLFFLLLIAHPLKLSFQHLLLRNQILRSLRELRYQHPQWQGVRLREVTINLKSDPPGLLLVVFAPEDVISPADVSTLKAYFSEQAGEPIGVQIELFEYRMLKDSPQDQQAQR